MDEGQSLYARGRYADAAQAFHQAYEVQPFAAFLFNEAVCHEKAGNNEQALATFRRYLTADPNPPDAEALRARIKRLEDATRGSAGAPSAPTPEPERNEAMHSLLVFESSPAGAPVQLWHRVEATAAAFDPAGTNPGWKLTASGSTPLVATLAPGHYHTVVERWRAYNRSDDEVDVATGRVVQYRASLSQGDFMGFLRIVTDNDQARIYLDDPPPHAKKPWGLQSHGELVARGSHQIWIEAPGYDTFTESFSLETGQQKVITPNLARQTDGFLLLEGNASSIQVWLDGVEAGVYYPDDGPLKIKASRGTHRLRAVAKGKKEYLGEVEVAGGQSREVRLLMSSHYGRGGAWVGVVGSAATLGAGIYLGLHSRSLRNDLRDDRRAGSLDSGDDRIRDGRTYAVLADVSFGLSAAFAGFALFEFLRDPMPPSSAGVGAPRDLDEQKRRSSRSMILVPTVAAGQGGLLWQGSF